MLIESTDYLCHGNGMDWTSSMPKSVLRLRVDKGQGLRSGILFFTSLVHWKWRWEFKSFILMFWFMFNKIIPILISLITANLTYRLDHLPPLYSWDTWPGVRYAWIRQISFTLQSLIRSYFFGRLINPLSRQTGHTLIFRITSILFCNHGREGKG